MLYVGISTVIILIIAIKPPKFVDRILGRIADKIERREWFTIVKRRAKIQKRNFWKYQTFHTAKWFSLD